MGAVKGMVIGLARAVTIQTSHGEMNATDAKNRNRVGAEVTAVAAAAAAVAATIDRIANKMDHHVGAPINSKIDVMARCEVVATEAMIATDHTKRNPFDLMITDFYI